MNIGEKIIAAIAQSHLVTTDDPYSVLIWSQSAAEQLEAVVEAEIERRVEERLDEINNPDPTHLTDPNLRGPEADQ